MVLPKTIKAIIGERASEIETIGRSTSQVLYFDEMVLKIEQQGEEQENEQRMMAWLSDQLPVPEILTYEKENGMSYLLMSRLEGKMSCDPELLEHPRKLVKLLARGLKMLWEVNITDCPTHFSTDHKLRLAEDRVRNHLCDRENVEPDTYGPRGFKDPADLLEWLKENRPEEEPVFSHGDYCLPNLIVKGDRVSGFIDLGRSGIADPYQDIALCYRSLIHNYDGTYGGKVYEGFEPVMLFDELGIKPDWDKIKYYILLDELF